jgi:hypothetical protein
MTWRNAGVVHHRNSLEGLDDTVFETAWRGVLRPAHNVGLLEYLLYRYLSLIQSRFLTNCREFGLIGNSIPLFPMEQPSQDAGNPRRTASNFL